MTESLWSDTRPPLSFLYNSQHSTALLPAWRRSESQESPTRGGRVKNIDYDDPATGLRMTVTLRRFDDFPAVDWVVEFENRSQTDSPILENILPLDIAIPASRHERLSLHHAKGSLSDIDDFHPRLTELWTHNPLKLAPVGGRSSNGTLPFMNLQRHGRGGVMIAIGWSGQWAASFKRDEEALHVTAGMEKTHLLLHPGEKIRTPRILLIEYAGDDSQAGQNALRRMLMANYMPRIDGELVLPPAAGTMQAQYAADWDTWLKTNMENVELKASPIMASLGLEVQWVDACWFGNDRIWCYESGNWYVNRGRFPHGLKAVSDSAHAHGMKFILWFEPCRVYEGTTITNEHPEFVLDRTDEWYMDELLFNFGLPEARDFMIETVSKIIAEEGVDIYREDFN